jgi:structural maintenance of chromosome 3 (chondroitin sulfate proteoglycan 6)
MADLVRERTELECDIVDVEQVGKGADARRKEIDQELERIEKRIKEVEEELRDVIPQWEKQVAQEREAKER